MPLSPTTIRILELEAERGRMSVDESRQELDNLQNKRAELIGVHQAELAELDEKIAPVRSMLARRQIKLAAIEGDLANGRSMATGAGTANEI